MKTISIQVSESTAKAIEQMSPEKLEQLGKKVEYWVEQPKDLIKLMEEMGEYAKSKGMTQEILDDLLKDE